MNKIHRTVWSESRQTYVVAHENAATRGKPSSTRKAVVAAVASALLAMGGAAWAGTSCVGGGATQTVNGADDTTCTLDNGDTLTVSGTGSISVAGTVVNVGNGITADSITNSGTLTSSATSDEVVRVGGGTITGNLVNNALIEATGSPAGGLAHGIVVVPNGANGGSISGIINNTGTITAADGNALLVLGSSLAQAVVNGLTNTGTISTTGALNADDDAIKVLRNAWLGDVNNTGTISSGNNAHAIHVYGSGGSGAQIGSITNDGLITGGFAIQIGDAGGGSGTSTIAGSIINQSNGRILTTGPSGLGATAILLQNSSGITGGITNSGTISGNYGIRVTNGSGIGGDIVNQTTGGIDGLQAGILVGNTSSVRDIINSGTIGVINAGTNSGAAIDVQVNSTVRNIINHATGVLTGATLAGISAAGGATISNITNAGTISALNGMGIDLDSSVITGGITNSGTTSAILGDVASLRDALKINNTDIGGSVINQGTIDGYAGIYLGGTSSIGGAINNQRLIQGADAGIAFEGSSVVTGGLTNSGTIKGTDNGSSGTAGVYFNGGNVGGIVNSGTIQGQAGIHIENGTVSGNITNSNLIRSLGTQTMSAGVILYGSSSVITGSIVNTGTILGDGIGVWVASSAAITGGITNSGTTSRIEGGDAGIKINSNSSLGGNIVNAGTIIGSSGILVDRSSTIDGAIINSGLIQGTTSRGINIYRSSHVVSGITNSGTILGATDGIGIYGGSGSTVSGGITNSGLIHGGTNGIDIDDGSIIDGDLVNQAGGTISGQDTAIEVDESSSITGAIINQGLIQSVSATGIRVTNSSEVQGGITNGGQISGVKTAIYIANSSSVGGILNQSGGVITSSGNSSSAAAIAIKSSANLAGAIVNHGTISSAVTGVFVSSSTIDNGITNSGSGVIRAVGAAAGTEMIGLYIYNSSTVSGGITNSGQIVATNATASPLSYGIAIRSSTVDGGIHNLTGGTISGGGAGIFVQGGGAIQNGITNSGLIQGTSGIGISLSGSSISGGIYNQSGGRIVGGNGIAIANSSGDDLDSVTNASGGTINGAMYLFSTATDVTNNGLWVIPEDPMSPGTYFGSTISGNFVQGSTGTLRIGAAGMNPGEYSQIVVGGNVTLGGTLDVDVKSVNTLVAGTLQDVITATGAITGTFASITDNSTLFDFTGVYNANDFDLNLVAAAASGGKSVTDIITSTGNTPAAGAAAALDRIFTDTSNPVTQLFVPISTGTDQEISDAVTQSLPLLTGGSLVASRAALSGMNRVIHARQEANRGLSSGEQFYGDQRLWMKPFGSWADQNDRKGVSGYDAKVAGIALGTDATISNTTRVGLAFAYAKADVDGNSQVAPNDAKVDVYQLIGYGSHALDADTEVNFQVGIGQNKNDGTRRLPSFGLTAKSNYNSLLATAGIGIGRTFKQSPTTSFTPSVRMDYTWIKDESYTEKGAGALNLDVKGRTADELILGLDGKLTHELKPGTTLSTNLGFGYDVLNEGASITSAYAGAPGVAFTTRGLDPSPWLVRGGLGMVHTTTGGTEITLRYDAEYRNDFLNQTASMKARWAF